MKINWNQVKNINMMLLFAVVLLAGCKVGPDYKTPEVILPDAWHQQATQGLAQGQADYQTWWLQLDDPVLTDLIDQAAEGNLDVKTAVSRIQQARALLGIATGQYYPQVDASGFYSRDRESKNGLNAPAVGDPDQTNLHNIGAGATWEADVFGRISRSVESSQATLEASVENYRDVLVVLYSDIAQNYIELRALQARIQYALDNIKLQQETLKLTQDRFDAELVPELDVQQARFNLANTESLLPDLRSQQVQAVNRLSVLLGRPAGQLNAELLKTAAVPSMPKEVLVGLPAELLRQRPDIRKAERALAAQTAQIGVATADLYPSFSLSGTLALEAQQMGDVGEWNSRTWGFGPGFRWNLFDGGRIRNNILFEEAKAQETLNQYKQTILLAVEEVENAMVSYQEEQVKYEALDRSVIASQKSVELVSDLYRNGLTDFQNVLDMQRFLSQQQDKLALSRGTVVKNLVRIYKALGGGWSAQKHNLAILDNQEMYHGTK
ncbi:MAG TPA: efflux transporter outer membrane subunit [Anaerohalosphaeraceae bacterium]|nr:efflux transporter outer membrane subunit [Anaerohalosphaeraceae bacterium]